MPPSLLSLLGARARQVPWYLCAGVVAGLWAILLANAGFAFLFPLELEMREGTNWLHALTKLAGVSIYDYSHVAYSNMNHGPLDPVLKHWLLAAHRFLGSPLLAFTEENALNRAFVLLLPFAFAVSALALARKRALDALFLAGAAYASLLCLGYFEFLVGRSDPLAAIFLLLQGTFGLSAPDGRRPLLRASLHGACAAACYLANWRFAPGIFALLCFSLAACPGARERARFAGAALLSSLALFLLIFLTELGGNWAKFYNHFYGFFDIQPYSPFWFGAVASKIVPFPQHLAKAGPWLPIFLGLASLSLAARFFRRRDFWWGWILPLFACLIALNLGAFWHPGGGARYYAPFLIAFLFLLLYWEAGSGSRASWAMRAGLVALVLAPFPNSPSYRARLLGQAKELREASGKASVFLQHLRMVGEKNAIYSEDLHYFKREYRGDVVDQGDHLLNFEPRQREKLQAHYRSISESPPPYVLAGQAVSLGMRDLLAKDYQIVFQPAFLLLYNRNSYGFLYRRKK